MDRRNLARTLTLIESGQHVEITPRESEPWRVLGVTGAPGVGKSCLVDHLVRHWVDKGENVAVLAVEPSSPVSIEEIVPALVAVNMELLLFSPVG